MTIRSRSRQRSRSTRMQGDRYGEIVKITAKGSRAFVKLDKSTKILRLQVNALRIVASPRETLKNAVFKHL